MGKRTAAIILALMLAFAVTAYAGTDWICAGCGRHVQAVFGDICPYCGAEKHEHTWQEATCEKPGTCSECGETEGAPLGHAWQEATCTQPKTCTRCGMTEGAPLGHVWQEATRTQPKTCTRCGMTEGGPLLISVGETMLFGHYEQDNDPSNGSEEIEWIVLAVDGDTATLISRDALDCVPYNESRSSVTWESCSLRKWLNETFLNTAFTAEEQARLATVTVTADANPKYSTNPGKATQDRVFLLSIMEAEEYLTADDARVCKATVYAAAQGAWTKDSGRCGWWLRSPGGDGSHAANVYNDGSVGCGGRSILSNDVGVRPVLVLRLS